MFHLLCRARYRGTGTDLSKVPPFKRHEQDCGSTEVQVARISARVTQLTSHLKEHKKDYAATRGLVKMLGQRRRLMTYLYKESRYTPSRIQRHFFSDLLQAVEQAAVSSSSLTPSSDPQRGVCRDWPDLQYLKVHKSWPLPLDISSRPQKLDLQSEQAVLARHS